MKARNDEEREVQRLHAKLPAPTMSQLNWIVGQDYEYNMGVYQERKRKVDGYNYFAVATTKGGWQICRYFLVHSTISRGGYNLGYVSEVSQRWMKMRDCRIVSLHIFEKQKMMNWQWMSQPYSLSAPLSLKNWNTHYARGGRTYFAMEDSGIYPVRRFSKDFADAGFAKGVCRIDEIEFYKNPAHLAKIASVRLDRKDVKKMTKRCYLPTQTETLYKIGEPTLALMSMEKTSPINKYWSSFLVARRNGLVHADWNLWLDYVGDLDSLGYDIHSPKYLVPSDIGVAHARILREIERRNARATLEADKKEIEKYAQKYIESMGEFFGISITTKGGLTIEPLKSVMEFYAEGKAMHHCVFSCGYYKKPTSLILSARDKDGMRVETIEVNLESMTIAQSRGVCNRNTERHGEIMDAVKRDMWKISDVERRMAMAS